MRLEEGTLPWEVLAQVITDLRAELGSRFLVTVVSDFDDFADAVFCRAQKTAPRGLPPSSLYELAIALLAIAPMATSDRRTAGWDDGPAHWPSLRRAWLELNEITPSDRPPSIDLTIAYGCSYEGDDAQGDDGRPWPGAVDALHLLVLRLMHRCPTAADADAAPVARHLVSHLVHGSCAPPDCTPPAAPRRGGRKPYWCTRPVTLEDWYPSLPAFLGSILAGNPPRPPARTLRQNVVVSRMMSPVPPAGRPVNGDTERRERADSALLPLVSFDMLDWPRLRQMVPGALDSARVIRSSSVESHLNSPVMPLLCDSRFDAIVDEITIGAAPAIGGVCPETFRLAVAFAAAIIDDDRPSRPERATEWEEVQQLLRRATARLPARGREDERSTARLEISEAEVVVAYGAGWRGPGHPLDLARAKVEATYALLAVLNLITTETYEAIIDRWGVEGDAPGPADSSGQRNERYAGDAQLILERLTNRCYCGHHRRGCPSARAARGSDQRPSQGCSCCKEEHRLTSWDPAKNSLWSFLRTAVRGPEKRGAKVVPSLRIPPATGAFHSSMLACLLEEVGLIRFVSTEAWRCTCSELVESDAAMCRRCRRRVNEREMQRIPQPDWIVPRRDEGLYREVLRRACARCHHLAEWPDELSERVAQRCPRCASDRLSQRPTHVWSKLSFRPAGEE